MSSMFDGRLSTHHSPACQSTSDIQAISFEGDYLEALFPASVALCYAEHFENPFISTSRVISKAGFTASVVLLEAWAWYPAIVTQSPDGPLNLEEWMLAMGIMLSISRTLSYSQS